MLCSVHSLVNEANHGWDAPSSGIGSIGTEGFTSYTDACAFMNLPESQSVFDYESKVPYAYRLKEWISFDNEQSLAYKVRFFFKLKFISKEVIDPGMLGYTNV